MAGAARLSAAFAKKPGFVAFVTAGFPTLDSTVPALRTLQAGGVDVIEVGVPFSDPLADGAVVSRANQVALENGVTLKRVLAMVKQARDEGVAVPIVLMGYLNPLMQYGMERFCRDAAAAGVDGVIVVDLLPEDAGEFLAAADPAGLAFVPLVAPTTTDERLPEVVAAARGFIYCVSVTGVTGARTELPPDLAAFVARVKRAAGATPIAVGFGLSTRAHVEAVSALGADGVVMGSAVVKALEAGGCEGLKTFLEGVVPPAAERAGAAAH